MYSTIYLDYTYYGFNLWHWAALEVNLGIICSSCPASRSSSFDSPRPSTLRNARTPKLNPGSLMKGPVGKLLDLVKEGNDSHIQWE